MGSSEGVDGFQDAVQGGRALGSVEEEGLLAVFNWLGISLFEDAGGARVAGFAVMGWRLGIVYIPIRIEKGVVWLTLRAA